MSKRPFYIRKSASNDPHIPVLSEEQVRGAIHVAWHAAHRPREPDFICPDGTKLIPKVKASLGVPNHTMIKSVLEDSVKNYLAKGGGYNPCRDPAGRRALKVDLASGEMLMISRGLRSGLGPGLVCKLVNIKRKIANVSTIHPSTAKNSAKRVGGVVQKRGTQAAGTSNAKAKWVQARVGQTDMVLRMLGPKAKLRPSSSPSAQTLSSSSTRSTRSVSLLADKESAVERCWTMLPDHRIVRDCDRWAEAYQIVNNHEGKVVRGWGRVTGRRSGKDRGEPAVPTAFHSDAADGVKRL